MMWQVAMAVAIGLAASVEDLAHRQVSNWTSVAALGGGLVLHFVERGWPGLWAALAGAASGFGIFLIFYLLGGMGGGDVKLMAGFGAVLGGAGRLLAAALWTAAAGGLLALLILTARALRRKLRPAKQIRAGEFMPYAPAITLGVWLELVARV